MQVDLKALNDNKSGIGTKVEIYAGALYQKFEVAGSSGYLGRNSGMLLVGLGSEKVTDAVRLLWPTGVPQDEIDLAANKTQSIAELDRRGSSCPILFSWNGKEYEFIADMIGPGVVGHWIAPGERDVPDPDEYLKVAAKSVQLKDGKLSFRFMEPMEETVYLDQVRLVAVDHPGNIEVNPNERFVSNPPFPEFRVIATEDAHVPAGAWDDRGHDVLPLLAKHDRKYVTDFDGLPFTGFAKMHWIELDLGTWDAAKPLRLLLDGYTDYFTATSMYAADQAGIKVIAPYVEAQDAQGKWVRVVEDMGFPAGLARTMVTDLTGKIPAGTRRIRIVSNLKIYWDRVRIDQTPPQADVRVSEVPLATAELAFLGYPKEIRLHPASDTVYSYSHRSATGPYAQGRRELHALRRRKNLLNRSDDKFTVFSSGEGVKLEFDPAGLPVLPKGWVRDYFFYADGFEKDLDFYAADAFTVEPLPHHGLIAYPYPAGKEYPMDARPSGIRVRLQYPATFGSHAEYFALRILRAEVRKMPIRRSGASTIRDVARESGYSASTVSIVLNNAPLSRYIPGETKERIQTAARRLGYRPNPLARSLRSQRSNIVGVMVFDITDPFCTPILRGLENALYQANYLSLLADAHNEPNRFERYLEMLLDRRVEGLIVIANWLVTDIKVLADLTEKQVPTVIAGRAFDIENVQYGFRG